MFGYKRIILLAAMLSLIATGVLAVPTPTCQGVIAVPSPLHRSFYIHYYASKVTESPAPVVKLCLLKNGLTMWQDTIQDPTKDYEKMVSYRGWGSGSCSLEVYKINSGGTLQYVDSISLKVPTVPAWESFKAPTTPAVPDPYVPIVATSNSACVWGRNYQFGSSIFLDQVKSAGEDILASPVTLTGIVNGQPIQWTITSWQLQSSAPEKVVYNGQATCGVLNISVTVTVEFDGMLRIDWTLTPVGGSQTVTNLALVVPVKRSEAQSFMQSCLSPWDYSDQSTWNKSGDLTDSGWACKFAPFFWIGNPHRGIQWFAESRLGWTPADDSRAIEVKCDTNTANLILHIADGARTFTAPISFTFGLMASPIRPRPAECDMSGNRIVALSACNQLNSVCADKSGIYIPAGRKSCSPYTSNGCVEMDFRPDWNTASPSQSESNMPLITFQNSSGNVLRLEWVASSNKTLRLTHNSNENGYAVLSQAPVSLSSGTWYRLCLNYSSSLVEVYLNGNKVISAAYDGHSPSFDPWIGWTIGGNGRMSLAGWCISKTTRSASEFQPGAAWTSDSYTIQLQKLTDDPTPLNWASGSTESPAYLDGNWKYDELNHWLIAGPDGLAMTNVERYSRQGARGFLVYNWSTQACGAGDVADPTSFNQCVSLCNQYGMKLVPYTPWGIAGEDANFDDYKWDMSFTDPSQLPVCSAIENGSSVYKGCAGSTRANLNLWDINRIMSMGGGGVYLDGQIYTIECSNPLHNHTVIDPLTGNPTAICRIFDQRKYLHDMYRLIKSYRPDAIVDSHSSSGFTLPPTRYHIQC